MNVCDSENVQNEMDKKKFLKSKLWNWYFG